MAKKTESEKLSSLVIAGFLLVFMVATVMGLVITVQTVDKSQPKVFVNGGKAAGKVFLTLSSPTFDSSDSRAAAVKDPTRNSRVKGRVSLRLLKESG